MFQYYCILQSLHKVLPSTTLYYKVCTKHVPVLLSTTKLAQSTSHYYFVLQSLHKALPSTTIYVLHSLHRALPCTTLYYEVCTKHVPLLSITKLAQSTSHFYFVLHSLHRALCCTTFVLQSLHKVLPSTLYYKACTKHKAQSLHKARPSTTLYHKACTEHFPVALCTTKLAQSTSQYFVLQILRKAAAPSNLCAKAKKKHDFEALFKRNLKRKITSAKIEKICWQITIAALMLPLQYDLQCPAAKDNSITYHACSRSSKQPWRRQTCMSRHTWQPNMATIMQPLHCDLPPRIQQAYRSTHTWTTTGCRTQRRNRLRPKRSQPQPPHTRGTFHRRLQPLYT